MPNADTRDLSNRRRRWYLGIQSKKDPAHVMNEVYKAMQSLHCVWHQVNNYRVLCLWTYTSGMSSANSPSLQSTSQSADSSQVSFPCPCRMIVPARNVALWLLFSLFFFFFFRFFEYLCGLLWVCFRSAIFSRFYCTFKNLLVSNVFLFLKYIFILNIENIIYLLFNN